MKQKPKTGAFNNQKKNATNRMYRQLKMINM